MSSPKRRRKSYLPNFLGATADSMPEGLAEYEPVLRLWMGRLLIRLGCHQRFLRENGVDEEPIASFLGLDAALDPETYELRGTLAELRQSVECWETAAPRLPMDTPLARNVALLAGILGLDACDQVLLVFAVLLQLCPTLNASCEYLERLTEARLHQVLSTVLDLPHDALRHSLGRGPLTASGLLSVDRNNVCSLPGKLELLSGVAEPLSQPMDDVSELFSRYFRPAPTASLRPRDYGHLAETLELVRTYLAHAQASSPTPCGLNILLHGLPGTGKTEFARLMAAELGLPLFEIAIEDEDGDPIPGRRRLDAYRLSQRVLARGRPCLLLFDEVEDVFRSDDNPFRLRGDGEGLKALINRTLESNPLPTFWLTNDATSMDAAFLRRFDIVADMKNPPRSVRETMLRAALAPDSVSERTIRRLADNEALTPALIERSAKVVNRMGDSLPQERREKHLEALLAGTLSAQGYPSRFGKRDEDAGDYSLDVVNADIDLAGLLAGLSVHGEGRLCLYGPPGTGKTAFAQHLAQSLDRPLLVKRASDLLSPWVGMTERLMAAMFEQARDEAAVLLLDEADSFLRNREGAMRSWEVTQVNEMLTQMESFEGIFVASTNLMVDLDAASLRRFDCKIGFGYLRAAQAEKLLRLVLEGLELDVPPAEALARLRALDNLTPGDFAVARRQARLRHVSDPCAIIAILEQESRVKPGATRSRIGFVSH